MPPPSACWTRFLLIVIVVEPLPKPAPSMPRQPPPQFALLMLLLVTGRFTEHPASNHPQFAMHALLDRFGIKRSDVEILQPPARGGRDMLLSEAMRPSNATA